APLVASMNFSLPVQVSANANPLKISLAAFLCPSDQLPGGTFPVGDGLGGTVATVTASSYAACVGSDAADVALGLNNDGLGNGAFFRNSAVKMANITDGASQTIFVLERGWGNAQGTWAGAIVNGVILRGQNNPCPGSASTTGLAPLLVMAHGHLIN